MEHTYNIGDALGSTKSGRMVAHYASTPILATTNETNIFSWVDDYIDSNYSGLFIIRILELTEFLFIYILFDISIMILVP